MKCDSIVIKNLVADIDVLENDLKKYQCYPLRNFDKIKLCTEQINRKLIMLDMLTR